MFISIPKEFFVPVIFGDQYILNLNTQNMELDTENNREIIKNVKAVKEGNINYIAKDNGKIYIEVDDEYVNSMTGSTVTEKEAIRLKDSTREKDVKMYSQIDDDYVKEARRK